MTVKCAYFSNNQYLFSEHFVKRMSLFKLQSSDGVIFSVDTATVKQMMTIQTMIDHEDEHSDEVIPVPTVKA